MRLISKFIVNIHSVFLISFYSKHFVMKVKQKTFIEKNLKKILFELWDRQIKLDHRMLFLKISIFKIFLNIIIY